MNGNFLSLHFKFDSFSFICGLGKYNIAKLLIENGADVHVQNDDGFTPLHYSVKEGI